MCLEIVLRHLRDQLKSSHESSHEFLFTDINIRLRNASWLALSYLPARKMRVFFK